MAGSITDLITKVGNPGTMTTLQAPGKPIGATSLLLTSPANWPADLAVFFSIQRIDVSTGDVVPGSYTVWKGILSGSAIDNLQLKFGSDQAYSAGEGVQVFIYVNTTWANSLVDGLLTSLRPNGTLKPSVVDFEALTAAVKQRMYSAGDIKIHGRAALDTGWLWCDGAVVSRTTYADLFAAIGTAFGAGDGTTTFKLPDLRGRVPVGLDASQTEFDTLGKSGGQKEVMAHSHDVFPDGQSGRRAYTDFTGSGSSTYYIPSNASSTRSNPLKAQSAGSGVNNMNPYQTIAFAIKS